MQVGEIVSSVAVAVIGLAIVAVIVSKRANTAGVIQASGSSFASIIGAAVSPISGGTPTPMSVIGSGAFGAPR